MTERPDYRALAARARKRAQEASSNLLRSIYLRIANRYDVLAACEDIEAARKRSED